MALWAPFCAPLGARWWSCHRLPQFFIIRGGPITPYMMVYKVPEDRIGMVF